MPKSTVRPALTKAILTLKASTPSQRNIPRKGLKRLSATSLAAIAFSFLALAPNNLVSLTSEALAQESVPAAGVVWQHVGRIYLNPDTGKAIWAGHVVHLNGINTPLFNGAPSESTAYFTFSTDILQLTPMPNDGDIALSLVSAGTFSVYYNATPNGNWSDPATFSSGELIARFSRKESLFPEIGPIGFHALSESLLSSQNFTFDNQTFNFNRIAPNGITFAQFFSTTPLTGITDYPVAFAGVGTTMAIGGSPSAGPAPRRSSSSAIEMNRFNRLPDLLAVGNQPTYRTIFRTR
jgi:hypothetical protein